jgi:hypothetical protein
MGVEAFMPLCIPVACMGGGETETERERKESGEVVTDTIFRGGAKKYISGFEGS